MVSLSLVRITFLCAFLSFLFLPALMEEKPVVHAGVVSRGSQITEGEAFGQSTVSKTAISSVIGAVIRALLSLLGTIFIVYLLYGGYKWMTAGGNEEDVKKAKDVIRQAVIGLIIVLSAYLITNFVVGSLKQATVDGG